MNGASRGIEFVRNGEGGIAPDFGSLGFRTSLLAIGHRAAGTAVIITVGQDVLARARAEGTLARLEAFGAQLFPDICWCSITEPLMPPTARNLMTNSGKYAHYAPGLSGRMVRFGSLAECVETARTGNAPTSPPDWLKEA